MWTHMYTHIPIHTEKEIRIPLPSLHREERNCSSLSWQKTSMSLSKDVRAEECAWTDEDKKKFEAENVVKSCKSGVLDDTPFLAPKS